MIRWVNFIYYILLYKTAIERYFGIFWQLGKLCWHIKNSKIIFCFNITIPLDDNAYWD